MGFLKNLLGLGVAAGTAYAAVKVAQKYNEKKKAEPDQNGDGTVDVNDTVYGVKDAAREVYEETAAKVREKAPEVREKAAAAAAAPVEEKTEFDVVMTDFGAEKIKVIKEVRGLLGLGLAEAKAIVEAVPAKLKEAISKDEAEEIKSKLEAVGAKIELK